MALLSSEQVASTHVAVTCGGPGSVPVLEEVTWKWGSGHTQALPDTGVPAPVTFDL